MVSGNYPAALVLALSFPDICGAIVSPSEKNAKRYEQWYAENVTSEVPENTRSNLPTSSECWQLRNGLLHSGKTTNINGKNTNFERFIFAEPGMEGSGFVSIGNRYIEERRPIFPGLSGTAGTTRLEYEIPNTIVLDVSVFCQRIFVAVEKWDKLTSSDPVYAKRKSQILRIRGRDEKIQIGPGVFVGGS